MQGDIALGGLAYQQEVTNTGVTPAKPLHFEPGVWLSVPQTTNPAEESTIVRMGSIPHGTTINAQGKAFNSPTHKPLFTPSSIVPFTIGSPDDGATGLVNFQEATAPLSHEFGIANDPGERTRGLTDAHFQDPSKILSDVADAQNIIDTEVFVITTNVAASNQSQSPNPGAPREGGGTDNIAFLTGVGAKRKRECCTDDGRFLGGDDQKAR